MVNNPVTNPITAKVMAVIFIALSPLKKKGIRLDDFLYSSSFFASPIKS
jgi:hypothetical protein